MAIVGNQPVEEQPSVDDWKYKFLPTVTGGINSSLRPDNLPEDHVVVGENVHVDRGNLVTELGYVDFGAAVRGVPQATYQFLRNDGTTKHVLVTTLTVYHWDTTVKAWHYPSNGTSTTLSGTEAAGQTVISVASASGFATGEFVGIALNNGTQHQTVIASISSNDITISAALPSEAASGKAFLEAVLLTGDVDDPVSIETLSAQDVMLFTNGNDKPQVYNGTTCIDMTGLPSGLTTAKFLGVFQNYVLLMFTTEGGTDYPQRVRNSNTGTHTNWTTGNAGSTDLYSNNQHIKGYSELGEIRVIYKSKSIIRLSYVGSDDKLFQFDDVIEGEGAINHACIAKLKDKNVFVGNFNIWEYEGGFDITPIGDKIFDLIFSAAVGSLNPSAKTRCFLMYVEEQREVWLFYPSGTDTDPKNSVRYSLDNESWHTRTWPVAINGHGAFLADSSITWNSATGTWNDHTEAWNSLSVLDNAPIIQLCGSDSQVYDYNFVAADDDGTTITFTVDTKDFFVPNRELRFDRFECMLKGNSVALHYSINEGTSWTLLTTFTPGAAFTRERIYKQFMFQTIRFRFTGTAGGFGLRWFAFKYKRESIW